MPFNYSENTDNNTIMEPFGTKTTDYDYSNISYYAFGSPTPPPLWEIGIKSIIFGAIILMSLLGNILIIVIVIRNRQMHTTTNYYIVNLAVADLMVTIWCTWVTLVDSFTHGWILGAFFCKVNTFMQVVSLVASVLSLTLIAYDRFFGIVFALRAHMTERRAWTSLIFIWIASILVASPLLVYRQCNSRTWKDYVERWCDDQWPVTSVVKGNVTHFSMPSRTSYYVSVSIILYFIPIICMTFAYSIIIIKLWSSTVPGEVVDKRMDAQTRTKRKVILMLVVILAIFCVCWMPYQIILLYSELRTNRAQLPVWYEDLQFAANCMAYSNSALNPVIYAGFNANFKRGLRDIWNCITCHEKRNTAMNGKYYGTYEMTSATHL